MADSIVLMLSIKYTDLEMAMDFTSDAIGFDAVAYICCKSGKIFYAGDDIGVEDEVPEDIDDPGLYVQVPDKRDLDLGKRLVMRFVSWALPGKYDEVDAIFRSRGAYARYKDLLFECELLEEWYKFEESATRKTLCEWAKDEGFTVESEPDKNEKS